MFVSKVDEDVASCSQGLSKNEARLVRSALLVELNKFADRSLCVGDAHQVVVFVSVSIDVVDLSNLHVWVELSKLVQACSVSAHFTDMFLPQVEVSTQIFDRDELGIVDVDGARASKDEVLSSLNTEASHADDKDSHLGELAHAFSTEDGDLAGIKVVIDFCGCFYHLRFF